MACFHIPRFVTELFQSPVISKRIICLVECIPLQPYPDSLTLVPAVHLLDPGQRHVGAGADPGAGPHVPVNDPPRFGDPVDLVGMLDRFDPVEGGLVGRRVPALHPPRSRQQARPRADGQHVAWFRVIVHPPAQPVHDRLRDGLIDGADAAGDHDDVELRCVVERVGGQDELREVRRDGRNWHLLRDAVDDDPVGADRV